jgi:hypothetical protein
MMNSSRRRKTISISRISFIAATQILKMAEWLVYDLEVLSIEHENWKQLAGDQVNVATLNLCQSASTDDLP